MAADNCTNGSELELNITEANCGLGYYDVPPYIPADPTWLLVVKIVIFAATILMTILGNGIVIMTIVKNRSMQKSTNYYIMNLAAADISIALFSEWTWLVAQLKDPIWPFGKFMCTFCNTFQGISVICSILTLTVIAMDRYFAVFYPLKSRVTKKNAGIVISLVWMVTICINIPLFIVYYYEEFTWSNGVFQTYCYEYWPTIKGAKNGAIYTLILFALTYVFPLLIMLLAYISIATKLWRARAPGEHIQSTAAVQEKSKKKVIKMLCVVVLSFALCWLPYHAYWLYTEWINNGSWNGRSKSVVFWLTWLGYSNSAINPLIYSGFNQNFRQGFTEVFTCRCWRKPNIKTQSKSYTYSSHADGSTVVETVA